MHVSPYLQKKGLPVSFLLSFQRKTETSQVLHVAFESKDEDQKYVFSCIVVINLFTLILMYSFILEPWMVQ